MSVPIALIEGANKPSPTGKEWRPFVWPFSLAVAVGLAARLVAAHRLSLRSTDTFLYEELGRHWLRYGVYGVFQGGVLSPSNLRAPGYPVFIAVIYRVFGESLRALTTTQALLDVLSCCASSALAALIAPRGCRARAGVVAIWLAALSPAMIGASVTALTETLSAFLTAAALLVLGLVLRSRVDTEGPRHSLALFGFLFTGFLIGMGTLVRPEAPLLLSAVFTGLILQFKRDWGWRGLATAAVVTMLGVGLPLAPWVVRNWRLERNQHLMTSLVALPSRDNGYLLWLHTWLWRSMENEPLNAGEYPPEAFDSPEERAVVDGLLSQASGNPRGAGASVQEAFANLAVRRAERHPLRTFVTVPLGRAWVMWTDRGMHKRHFLPRTPKLDTAVNEGISAFTILTYLLAIAGACLWLRVPMVAAMVAALIVRTAFLTAVDLPEPRYVLVLFPAVFALAGCGAAALSRMRTAKTAQLRSSAPS